MQYSQHTVPSGLDTLEPEEWRTAVRCFRHFDACMDAFLQSWARRMRAAGYLDFTTARHEDCRSACRAVTDAILHHADLGRLPTFENLRSNADGWADALLQTGVRHWKRGVTGSMFLGCFKTFIMAMKEALAAQDSGSAAARLLVIYAHAFEVLWLESCPERLCGEQDTEQAELFRLLTLEKCRFENVLETASDGVLVMDGSCRITTTNRALRQYAGENSEGKFIWEVLHLDADSAESFFRNYPPGTVIEAAPFGDGLFFSLSVTALSAVSLASSGEFLVLLTNITPLVQQRERLEEAVALHIRAQLQEKQRLEEMNITLRTVLSSVHSEQVRRCEALSEQLRDFLLPALRQLDSEQEAASRQLLIDVIRQGVEQMLNNARHGGSSMTENVSRKLTLTELKVCRLIQAGHSSKEIACLLHISPETVQTHRKHIRRKLGIHGRDAQLAVLLRSVE